jgi:enoyl-CoA hydratase
MTEPTVLTERHGRVLLVTLNRPKALNALNSAVLAELLEIVSAAEADPGVGALVLTGSPKAFAAGADIAEMATKSYMEIYQSDLFGGWERFAGLRKPVVAAVQGYALGGGCEVVMMCDIVIAGEGAKFGQPEITLGILPGMGGTQRLVRAIGKAKAMDLVLTGRMMDAAEAERAGLVARVVPDDKVVEEALAVAAKIASLSAPAVMLAKESVNRAFETPLAEGLRFERRVFHSLFATEDQKEGMAAFLAKRPPSFKNR